MKSFLPHIRAAAKTSLDTGDAVKNSPKITCALKALAYTSIPESESDTDDDTGGDGGLPEEILPNPPGDGDPEGGVSSYSTQSTQFIQLQICPWFLEYGMKVDYPTAAKVKLTKLKHAAIS